MKRGDKKIYRGYILIELLVAISVLTLGLFGFYSLLSNSLSQNRLVSDQITANYLAMEGIELAKNLIDRNIVAGDFWNLDFTSDRCVELDYTSDILPLAGVDCGSGSSQPLLFSTPDGTFGYLSGARTNFYRTIQITPSSDRVQINSRVRGSGRGGVRIDINLEDRFYGWH